MLKKSIILGSILASFAIGAQAHEVEVKAYPMLSECGDNTVQKAYPMLSEEGQDSQAKAYPVLGEDGHADLHQHAPWR